MDDAQQAADDLVLRLEGRTIVRSQLDVHGDGFHLELDDGRILTIVGNYIVGLYQPVEATLQ